MVSLCGNIIHLKGIVLFENLKHNSKKYTRRYYYKTQETDDYYSNITK